MPENALKEIESQLAAIIVFTTKFKKEILAKAENLSETKLKNLKKILTDVGVWQKSTLQILVKKDPQFYNRLMSKKKKIEQEIINLYKTKLVEEDNKKMQIILDKMQTLYGLRRIYSHLLGIKLKTFNLISSLISNIWAKARIISFIQKYFSKLNILFIHFDYEQHCQGKSW